MKKHKLRLIILPVLLIAVVAIFFILSSGRSESVEIVNIGRVVQTGIQREISASAILQAQDEETILLAKQRKIMEVHVREGEMVLAGQLLAEYDMEDLQLQRERLVLAGDQLLADQEELESPTLVASSIALRTRVSQADVTANTAKRRMDDAQEHFVREQNLFDQGMVSEQSLKTSKLQKDEAEGQLRQAQLALSLARAEAGDLPAGTSRQSEALSRRIAQNQIDLALLDRQISDSRLISSIAGRVIELPLLQNRYPEGDFILIQKTDQMLALASFPQDEAVQVKPGQRATVRVNGLTETLGASVLKVASNASVEMGSGSRTPKVSVTLELDRTEQPLLAGFDADVTILTGSLTSVMAVKREALQTDENGSYFVYSVDTNTTGSDATITGTVLRVPVNVLLADSRYVALVAELEVGDPVILAPPSILETGMAVKGAVVP